jgi:hypothetical protein
MPNETRRCPYFLRPQNHHRNQPVFSLLHHGKQPKRIPEINQNHHRNRLRTTNQNHHKSTIIKSKISMKLPTENFSEITEK